MTETMRAVVFENFKTFPSLKDVEKPTPGPGEVLQDVSEVVRRMVRWVSEGTLTAVDGSEVRVEAESICLHGDTPGAVSLAAAVRTGLEDAGVAVRPFVP